MSEIPSLPETNEIKRADCYYSLSVSIGAGVTFLLGVIPPLNLLCINFIIGAFVTVYHFNKTNEISVTKPFGIRVGFYGTAIGGVLLIIMQCLMFYRIFGTDLRQIKQMYMDMMSNVMDPQQLQEAFATIPDELTVGFVTQITFWFLVVFMIAAFICSLIGGSYAAAKIKRGPLVR
ncbi:hypothetical protein MLD52_06600 [Puniceicoccaceae bacterium K14]|nr:hypothetical protein [Puniceicoccaceae bacterium K14]